jgi:hypothetical protein
VNIRSIPLLAALLLYILKAQPASTSRGIKRLLPWVMVVNVMCPHSLVVLPEGRGFESYSEMLERFPGGDDDGYKGDIDDRAEIQKRIPGK